MTQRVKIYRDSLVDVAAHVNDIDGGSIRFTEKNITLGQAFAGGDHTIISLRQPQGHITLTDPEDSGTPIASIDGTEVTELTVTVDKVVSMAGERGNGTRLDIKSDYLLGVYTDDFSIDIEDLQMDEVDTAIMALFISYTSMVIPFNHHMVQWDD